MNDAITLILAAVFLAAIPLNIYCWREVRRLASIPPRIPILSLLSSMVGERAFMASVIAILAFVSVLFLATGIRVIPMPGTTIILVAVLIFASYANVRVLRYLRRMRRPDRSAS